MSPGICVICSKPCIAMCPVCGLYVHHAYGQFNDNCSTRHEGPCPGARMLRELPAKEKLEFPTTKLGPPQSPRMKKKGSP